MKLPVSQPEPDPASTRQVALDLLSSAHLRRTTARTQVLQMLLMARSPVTAQELESSLEHICVDTVTVYRTLATLVEKGLVQQVDVGDRVNRYELRPDSGRHGHFVCVRCGDVHCLGGRVPMTSDRDIADALGGGFVVQDQQLLVQGFCPNCSGPAANAANAL